ncbi:hypothetical protein HanPI659440_Chr04g0178781 [Helianthus annuus]|nr:hypothetical protein HanPI659440_Chr04g0178781 [Helianthus annuus]
MADGWGEMRVANSNSCLDDFGEFTPLPKFQCLTLTVDYSDDNFLYHLFFAHVLFDIYMIKSILINNQAYQLND